ncbi:MAG: tetratricopeptide repeat protein [Gammaproteobacteria bacterium]|nr:tetratricopeptide repeat protein [Gammaproteobacteria bacterium]
MQLAEITFPAFGLSDQAILVLIVALAIGLVPALTLAWVFEITPEGIKRERDLDRAGDLARRTNNFLDRLIIVLLALGVTYLAFDKFLLDPVRDEVRIEAAREKGRAEASGRVYGEKSIVVLPFINLSGDPEQEYFSDGMSEQLLELLSRIPELRVISRASAFSFKGKNVGMQEIADQLSVSHVLDGSVRLAGDQVRITAQLIDAQADANIWSQKYDRPIDDIFAIQDEIAAIVVQELKVKLLQQTPTVQHTKPEAFALFLQARQLSRSGTEEAYQRSSELYQESLSIDPNYAAAWNGLAVNYFKQFSRGIRYFDDGYGRAREAARKALDADPAYSPAFATLGLIAMDDANDLVEAARHFERALELAPHDLEIIRHVVVLLQGLGRLDEAIALGQYAIGRDPVNAPNYANLGNSYRWSRRPEEAISAYRAALRLSPDLGAAQSFIGIALLAQERHPEALESMEREPFEPYRLIGLTMVYHSLGEAAKSGAVLAQLIEKYGHEWAYNIAYVHAWRGDTEGVFQWLDMQRICAISPALDLPNRGQARSKRMAV